MKALILAAGFGTRLKPLTNYIPKPLCPYFGIPLFDLAYWQIQRADIHEIACNSHYLSQTIKAHLQNSPLLLGRQIVEFHEPEIRGTGGCLFPLRDWLGPEGNLLIYNGDIVSDIDIQAAFDYHLSHQCDATMVLLPQAKPDKTSVFIDRKQNILQFGGGFPPANSVSAHTFTGIHIVSADFVQQIPEIIPWSIIDTYQSRIKDSFRIKAYLPPQNVIWHDLGTPLAYWQAHEEVLTAYNTDLPERLGLNACHEAYGYTIDYQTDQHSLINQKTKQCIHTERLHKTIILADNCSIADHVQLDQCIVLPGVQLIEQSARRCIISAYTSLQF